MVAAMPTELPPRESPVEAEAAGLDHLLQAARPRPAEDAVLARARIAGRLFGTGGGLGRFTVLDRLGRGGMGMVYAAYDPQLDRSVALKTVHVPKRGHELALQEAKALAKLSHPNVVPVFDVGIEADQVYIVMELVRGQTLRDWVVGKDLRTVLDAYRQAGQALAAAHDVRLVHRDFKPDNAIVGLDGRVRVVDFGLACQAADSNSQATTARRAVGTPKYMAPEQRGGGAVTAAADQYSFCVSLAEALRPPLPGWVEAVTARGCADDPAARYGSMHDLLRAFGRDPVRRRRQRLVAAGVGVALAGVATAAFAFGHTKASEVAHCSGGNRELQATWPSAMQLAALTRIGVASRYGQSLYEVLDRQLASYRMRWAVGHRDACLAERAGELSDRLFDRRMACLDQSRVAFATVAHIAATTRVDDLPNVARAASAIPDPDACRNLAALASDVEPPAPHLASEVERQRDELAAARVQLVAARYADARAATTRVIAKARAIDYRPLLAEALLVDGHALLLQTGQDTEGIAVLREATSVALEINADDLAVEAWARRAWLEANGTAPGSTALGGVDVVAAIATRTRTSFPRALLHNNIGSVELGWGHRTEAMRAFERALLDARHVKGAGAIELIGVRQNLALTVDDENYADQLMRDARRDLVALLGGDHPDVLTLEYIWATGVMASLPRALALLSTLCGKTELHPSLSAQTARCLVELADVRFELGDQAGAVAALDRALGIGASRLDDTPEARGYSLLWQDDPSRAASSFAAALAQPLAPDAPWHERYYRAKSMLGLGRARFAEGRLAAAQAVLEPAVAMLQEILDGHPAVAVERRLGRARAELARIAARTGQDATASADQALVWFRRSEAAPAAIAELDRLRRK